MHSIVLGAMSLLIIFLILTLPLLNAVSAEDERSLGEWKFYNGYCYRLNEDRLTWENAEESCYKSAPQNDVNFQCKDKIFWVMNFYLF